MKYYLEITLSEHSELGIYGLWEKFFTQLHLALVEMQGKTGSIFTGISFPEYRYEDENGGYLGNKLRVFGETEDALKQLDLLKWLSQLTNSIHSTGIQQVPSEDVTGYVRFQRKHIKGSLQNLSKRYAKRHNISIAEAEKHYNGLKSECDLPFLNLKSLSNDQTFRLFISKVKSESFINKGFGTYGLSTVSTVPEF